MERNVMGELSMHRAAGTKPSFSDIARRHGLDRHTVAKYWREGGEAGDRRSDRESAFERVRPIVEAKAVLPGATKKGVHEMLLHLHNDPPLPGYGAFTAWCRRQGVAFGSPSPEAHPRFETPPGRQLQFDWKEDVRLADANGEVFEFNVWSGTLGHSRRHRFIPTRTRTTDDLLACLLESESAPFPLTHGVPFRHDAVNGERGHRTGHPLPKYSAEFKQQAERLYRERVGTYAEIARELGVDAGSISDWVKKADTAQASPEDNPFKVAEENRRLRREVERLRRENEVLLKASAFFASRQL